MATGEFYVVYIKRKSDVTFDAVQKKMDQSLDWHRINESLWVLYTSSDAEKWYGRLAPLVKPSGSLFICKLDTKMRQGWMDTSFWDWLRRNRE